MITHPKPQRRRYSRANPPSAALLQPRAAKGSTPNTTVEKVKKVSKRNNKNCLIAPVPPPPKGRSSMCALFKSAALRPVDFASLRAKCGASCPRDLLDPKTTNPDSRPRCPVCCTTCFEIRLSPIALSVAQLPRFLRLVNLSLTTNARPADYPKLVGLPHPTCRRFLRAIATFKGTHRAVNNTPFGDP